MTAFANALTAQTPAFVSPTRNLPSALATSGFSPTNKRLSLANSVSLPSRARFARTTTLAMSESTPDTAPSLRDAEPIESKCPFHTLDGLADDKGEFTAESLTQFIGERYPAIAESLTMTLATAGADMVAKNAGQDIPAEILPKIPMSAAELAKTAIQREGSFYGLDQGTLANYIEPEGPRDLSVKDLMAAYDQRFQDQGLGVEAAPRRLQAYAECDLLFAALAQDGKVSSDTLLKVYDAEGDRSAPAAGNAKPNSLTEGKLAANLVWRIPHAVKAGVGTSMRG